MRLRRGLIAATSGTFLVAACGVDTSTLAVMSDAGTTTPAFTDDAATVPEDAASRLRCIATECPEGRADCPDTSGYVAHCGTHINDDPNNCGACGHVCYIPPAFLNIVPKCEAAKCTRRCTPGFGDCNLIDEDGCETPLLGNDPANCGGCGIACTAPNVCEGGQCNAPSQGSGSSGGPPPPTCEQLCGSAPATAPPRHMVYECSPPPTCWTLACEGSPFSASQWADCNGDLTDGCEVDLKHDRQNCAQCGRVCAAGLPCLATGVCGCPAGTSECGDACIDLLHDPDNCGSCGLRCAPPYDTKTAHTQRVCDEGRCKRACEPGWASCDGDLANGCETDLQTSGANCGACGRSCDVDAGQPCVDGVCLMKECDAGATR
ncbi:Tryptophan synthase alpha chain [Labilithrix luteola]|uniref:Tryptophan synthase alpha chain n=1 Tax=Labilithrix luteola TaxID=1391654 RepID=A0A0K1Q3X7_9BACT|nr:hypothetical protein [Labilithrix luteola]AKV00342.1 Tryptophan synthase alpha chain [Labilithrix luteola]